MSPPLLPRFLEIVAQARESNNACLLANCIGLHPTFLLTDENMISLRLELLRTPYRAVCEDFFADDDWPGFVELVVGYLQYVAEFDPGISNGGLDALGEWFERFTDFVNVLGAAFSSAKGTVLVPTVKNATTLMTNSAMFYDKSAQDPRYGASEVAMNVVLKIFNYTLGERTLTDPRTGVVILGKKEATLHVGNLLFKMYFKFHQIRLCPTIHNNIATAGIPALLHRYPKAQRTTYFYYHGRHHLFSAHFTLAHNTLSTAYTLCPPSLISQRRLILIYLTTASIILGKFPTAHLFSAPEAAGLGTLFWPVCAALQKGDFRAFRAAMGDEEAYLPGGDAEWRKSVWIKWGVYLVFQNRCQILLWRGLVRRTLLLFNELIPDDAAMGPPKIPLEYLVALGRLVHFRDRRRLPAPPPPPPVNPLFHGPEPSDSDEDEDEDEDEEETDPHWYLDTPLQVPDLLSIVISLLDQGFLKGYLTKTPTTNQQFLVVSRNCQLPRVAEVFAAERWKWEGVAGAGGEFDTGEESFTEGEDEEGPSSWGWRGRSSSTASATGRNGGGGGRGRGRSVSSSNGGGGRVVNLSGVRPVGM